MRDFAAAFLALMMLGFAPGINDRPGIAGPSQEKVEVQKRAPYPRDVKALTLPKRVNVEAIGPSRGPADAPITIIEFADFQCPFCSRYVATLEQVREKYGDKVRLVFRQFPLSFHAFASKAAEASLCAHEQGKFWEMHDAMFANQQQLSIENLKAKAAELGLNAEQFNGNLDSGKYAAAVQRDKLDGQKAGVAATPAIFINGIFVNGAVPFERIAEIVDAELARLQPGNG